jgi:hypothetical protein
MPIELPDPVVIPATPEKVLSAVWLRSIVIESPSVFESRATITELPFSPTTGEIAPGSMATFWTSPNLLDPDLQAAVPSVQVALDAIVAAVEDLKTYLSANP